MDLELVYRPYKSEVERVTAIHDYLGLPNVCPKCGSKSWKAAKHRLPSYYCAKCTYTSTTLRGTMFYHSKYSLGAWYELIKLMRADPKLGPTKLARTLGVGVPFVEEARKRIKAWLYTLEDEQEEKGVRKVPSEVGDRIRSY